MSKKAMRVLLVLAFIMIGIPVALYFWYDYGNKQVTKRRFKKQIGTYSLDIKKTKLGAYSKDSGLYEGLRIIFNADSTFSTNMQVPFIYDSIGRWEAGGAKEWNGLTYKRNGNIKTQFGQCCLADSTFYLNSTTPQEGQAFIQEIYFKKVGD